VAHDLLTLPRVLDLAAAEDFLALMRAQLKSDRALCLDASEVETLTLPCIQIILAAGMTHVVTVARPSPAFAGAFADLALAWQPHEPACDAPADDTAGVVGDIATEAAAHSLIEPQPAPPPQAEPAEWPETGPPPVEVGAFEPASADAGLEPEDEPAPPAPEQPAAMPAPAADEPQPSLQYATDETAMSKRILTIDDSKTMRDMLLLTLADAGFEVLQAVDGQDGLDVLGKERVDVVITDINMPKMDGYEVIRNLRRDPVHKTTPILVLTTESDSDKRVIARDAGATGWMVKPFDPDRLVATIRKVAP
jgi:two-component system chemotaxis response regulator CheY